MTIDEIKAEIEKLPIDGDDVLSRTYKEPHGGSQGGFARMVGKLRIGKTNLKALANAHTDAVRQRDALLEAGRAVYDHFYREPGEYEGEIVDGLPETIIQNENPVLTKLEAAIKECEQ